MRALLLLVILGGCAVHTPIATEHPANPHAPIGRLAGAPASLRPGVIVYDDVPVTRPEPTPHHHH